MIFVNSSTYVSNVRQAWDHLGPVTRQDPGYAEDMLENGPFGVWSRDPCAIVTMAQWLVQILPQPVHALLLLALLLMWFWGVALIPLSDRNQ